MRESDIEVLMELLPGLKRAFDNMIKEYDRRLDRYLYQLTITMFAVDIMLLSAIHGRNPREK